MSRRSVLLRELVPTLRAALDELMASDLERRPFVIVEDVVTRRFVQFARLFAPKTGALLFDVPSLGVVLLPCPDTKTGAEWAARVLAYSFGLPDIAELVVINDGDAAN